MDKNITNINQLPQDKLDQLKTDIAHIWSAGPRVFADSFHVDPYALSSATIVGDLNLVNLAQQYRVHGPIWNQYYPWGRQGHFNSQRFSMPDNLTGDSQRVSEVMRVYEHQQNDPVTATNAAYLGLLDLIFGLDNLEVLGLTADILIKENYETSDLPKLFQQTLYIAYEAGFPVVGMMHGIAAGTMAYKTVGQSDGYLAGYKGDWFNPTQQYFRHSASDNESYHPNKNFTQITQLVLAGSLVPTKGSTEIASMLALSLARVPLHHFGNQNFIATTAFNELPRRYALNLSQMTLRNKDRWSLVKDGEGREISLPEIYTRFGRLSIEALVYALRKGTPLTVAEAQNFLLNET